jgi:outer membrane protein TolC
VKRNPRRPPVAWWNDCIARVSAAAKATRTKVLEPRAMCGAAWWKLSPQKRAAIVRKLEGSKDARARGAAVALARAEAAHRRKNPSCDLAAARAPRRPNAREVVSLVYLEQKPGDAEPFEYEHDFEGDRPRLEMRGGKAQLRGGSYKTRDGWLEG